MDSSFLLNIVAAAIVLFPLLRKFRFRQGNKVKESSSCSSSSPSSSLTPLSVPPSWTWTHHVFLSFRGEDVRRDFLSHIQMEFERMGITTFIDNEIKRGESIGPELFEAIRGSKIAIILLSQNYASSKWCLDELVEIMKCREEFGLTVMAIFYRVDPSDVKKLTGNFGKVFRKTCAGKTKEDIGRWKQALEKVATIAGYHSNNWENEAAMIKEIATDISNKLNNFVSSSDFDGFIGMRAHLEKMKPLLCLESNEVRMIGIWGPPGIGKTTIARVAYNQLSKIFQLSVFMENIKANYTRPCSDDYHAKLQLQQQLMSQITNHKDMQISHLGVAQDRLKDKKVLVVLDGVDKLAQLDAMAKETLWFGPGSRIIITTQDHKLFRAHGVNHIYKVHPPTDDEALQIFCMYAFGQKSPKEGFEKVSWEVTELVDNLPLGLRVMGSYFRGMSKQEWKRSLPRLRTSLDADIQSILKFSYDALDDEDKDLFLHLACYFNISVLEDVEEYLAETFLEVRQRINVLAEKSLISIDFDKYINMHSLLEKLGREIVRKQSIHEPGQRQFLIEGKDICEVLTSEVAGSKNVRGIFFNHDGEKLDISGKAFERMSSLQFLILRCNHDVLQLPGGLNYLSSKLRILEWSYFPMTCLPSTVNWEFLVELCMPNSKLEKLWEGIKSIRSLKRMNLSNSKNLKELPNFSTATNLKTLDLRDCCTLAELPDFSTVTNLERLNLHNCCSLAELPSSIGYANNLDEIYLSNCSSLVKLPSTIRYTPDAYVLDLRNCSSLIKLPSFNGYDTSLEYVNLSNCKRLLEIPSSIGNAANLKILKFSGCSSLVDLPRSIGDLQKLQRLILKGCSKLEVVPAIIDLKCLDKLDLTDCSALKSFPEILTNVNILNLRGIAIEEVPPSIRSCPRYSYMHMTYFEKVNDDYPPALSNTDVQEVSPPWAKRISRLRVQEACIASTNSGIPALP